MATATTTTQSSLPAGYSASDLVFNDDFSGTTLDRYWNTYITSNAATVTATDQTSNSSSAAQSIAVTDPASVGRLLGGRIVSKRPTSSRPLH